MNKEKIKELQRIIQCDYSNIAGIIVQKNGKIQYERYFNQCTEASRVHVYSVTKSIVSALIGIAVDQGYIKSLDQKVLDFFPDYEVKKNNKTIRTITLENLMTMTAPYKYKFSPYLRYFMSDDHVKFSLDLLGGKGQIGRFRYAPLIGPDILSGILIKATGQSVLNYAEENLFSPLGITVKSSLTFKNAKEQQAFNRATDTSGWAADERGVNSAGWGLTLSPADMTKIGQLYLDQGLCNGKQVLSANWIKESTREHSRWDKQNLPYGYLWWVIDEKEHAFAAMGDGGNTIYVNTAKKLVVSIASLFHRRAKDRLEFIKQYIEPAFAD